MYGSRHSTCHNPANTPPSAFPLVNGPVIHLPGSMARSGALDIVQTARNGRRRGHSQVRTVDTARPRPTNHGSPKRAGQTIDLASAAGRQPARLTRHIVVAHVRVVGATRTRTTHSTRSI